jgi:beta-phosphoglucomutase-like phosphatase (HAD superfamily)
LIPCAALLFDMDGLMVDSEPLWLEVERDFARARGGDFTAELARECVGRGLANTLAVMHRTFGVPVDPVRDAADIVEHFIVRVGDLGLKPGFLELFDEARARDVPRALASSSARRLVEAILGRFEVRERFDAVVSGDDVVHPKPAPDIFLEAARRLGVAPPGCVVLEDSPSGVRAARAAGMPVIAVPESHPEAFAALADAVVTDLHEARRLLAFG